MHITARSHLTAGMAVLGAGAIALSPIQPSTDHSAPAQERAVSNLAINLASSIDPITPWVNTFQTAVANIQTLGAFYAEKPFPLLQTIGANIGTYFTELTNGNASVIPGQITNNIRTFFESPWWNAPGQTVPSFNSATPPAPIYSSNYISSTRTVAGILNLVFSQSTSYTFAPTIASSLGDNGPVLVQFTATPYSGQLLGFLSPGLSATVQLVRSFTAVGELFQGGDVIGALNELINIPANVTNAYLNGAGRLDLTNIVKEQLPPAVAGLITSAGAILGGFLSPPVPFNGNLTNPNQQPTQFTGGTLWDAVQVQAAVGGATTGLPVGQVQSVIGLGQFLANNLKVTPVTTGAAPTASAAAIAPAAAVDVAPVVSAPVAPAPVEAPAPVSEPAPADIVPSALGASEPDVTVVDAPVAEVPTASAPEIDAPKASGHRGGGDDNGGQSGGKGHRGAA